MEVISNNVIDSGTDVSELILPLQRDNAFMKKMELSEKKIHLKHCKKDNQENLQNNKKGVVIKAG